jgi:subtilisin family serine protease
LALDPETRWAELNFISQAPEGRPGYFFVSGAPGAPALLDESYAPALLGYTQAQTCETGAGVKIAVLDTGIDAAHPLLAGRIADGGWNALANSAETADAGNGRDDDGDSLVDEMVGHGTHVAGIIAAVAPDAMILPVKVLSSDGAGDAFFIAAGIHYAVDQRVQVINLSLGSTYDSRVIAEAVAEAAEAGVVVVAAAGNASTDRPIEFPAANAGVISVAATDAADLKSSFSNFGAQVDLSAPGVDIASALPGGQIGTWSGTSMSAPFVSGTAALVAQAHPSWSAPQITTRLLRTSSDLDTLNPDFAGELGAGRLDVDAAVRCEPDQVAIANR